MHADNTPSGDIRVTVVKVPRRPDDQQTVMRLMRQAPAARKTLKNAQEHRKRTLVVRSRGKRPWEVRRKVGKVVRLENGESWEMRLTPQLAPDLRAVAKYLKVEQV